MFRCSNKVKHLTRAAAGDNQLQKERQLDLDQML